MMLYQKQSIPTTDRITETIYTIDMDIATYPKEHKKKSRYN